MGLRSYAYILGPIDCKKCKNFSEQSDGDYMFVRDTVKFWALYGLLYFD